MKLKQKLANTWRDTNSPCSAFLDGFKKAKELILEALKDSCTYEWDEDVIERVGEEEVQ